MHIQTSFNLGEQIQEVGVTRPHFITAVNIKVLDNPDTGRTETLEEYELDKVQWVSASDLMWMQIKF